MGRRERGGEVLTFFLFLRVVRRGCFVVGRKKVTNGALVGRLEDLQQLRMGGTA